VKRKKRFERLIADWPAKILSLAAAVLLFLFYRINTMEERFFTVPLKVDPPAGLAVARPYPRSVKVTLRGREDSIYSLLEDDVEAYADFGGTGGGEGQFRVPVRVARKGGTANAEPLEIRVEPNEVSLTLEAELKRTVDVEPRFAGAPALGFELIQYTLTPGRVEISGARSVVSPVSTVQSDTIDLAGRTGDFSVEVGILHDNPLIHYPRDAVFVFRGIIREAVIIKSFDDVDIISLDLPPTLRLASLLPKGSIRLQGTQLAIESLAPDQLRLDVDCSRIPGPGTYTLPTSPDIPPDFVVLKYEPRELTLSFIPNPAEEGAQ
jgi:hypothetical protein